jgi:hypothetical protein
MEKYVQRKTLFRVTKWILRNMRYIYIYIYIYVCVCVCVCVCVWPQTPSSAYSKKPSAAKPRWFTSYGQLKAEVIY